MKKNKKIIIGATAAVVVCGVLVIGGIKSNQSTQIAPEVEAPSTYVIPNAKKVILSGSVAPSNYLTLKKESTKGASLTFNVSQGDSVNAGDVLVTYYNEEITDQLSDLNDQLKSLQEKKAKFTQDGTSSAKTINKQIKALEEEKSKIQQDTKNAVNKVLKQLEELTAQKSAINPEQEDYEALVSEINAQIEACYVQKNDLEYNLPIQVKSFDEQMTELRSQLSDEDQETFNDLDSQITKLSKDIERLKEKEAVKEVAPFDGIVSFVDDTNEEGATILKLKSPDYYVLASVNEKDYAQLTLGMEAETLIIATNQTVSGKVTFIDEDPMSGGADSQGSASPTYLVKVSLEQQEALVNGYQVQVSLKAKEEAISVPKDYVVVEGNSYYTYVLEDGDFVKRSVEVVGEGEEYYLIESGLNERDQILTTPSEVGNEGEPVE